ncbi:FAS1 domain-containing protein [Microdochium bolleyi]|uniref:FAS1 domain-containing protein n=1 Tax=Microdochium bolleyi TaxID=196109 RepID=A0A136IU67_9PEZI|nr:FAS1 domain-containing protein [Microdochium bolleyi]
MQLRRAFALGLAGTATAQNGTPDLATALSSQNSSLSLLNGLIANTTGLADTLRGLTNVTILAPNNDAIQKILSSSMAAGLAMPGAIQNILSYHVLNGTYYASNFTSSNMSMFIPTHLTNSMYSLVSGGQRVEVMYNGTNVTAYSGLKQPSRFVTTNVNFTGGTIHIIDSVLTVPMNVTSTLPSANLTAAAGAIRFAGLNQTIDTTQNLTIFAPSNDAFNAVGSVFSNFSMQQVAQGLQYHVVQGLGYSSTLMNMTMRTLAGQNLNITVINGTVYVNSAKVTIPNILVRNGVVHVIDQVLNANQTGASPQPGATTTTAAFSGASTGTAGIPFTSGVTAATSNVPAASTTAATSSRSNPAMPIKTGAVGAAALFGGAAVMMNL